MRVTDLSMAMIGDMFGMLRELVTEIDRSRTPLQVGGRSHIKSVILDAQGQPQVPPPIAHQLAYERREQFAQDRHDAMMSLDPAQWRTFALRWGLTPPPGGWEDHATIVNMMHRTRLEIDSIPYLEKHLSATHCASAGINMPKGMFLRDGVLYGTKPE